MAGQPVDPKTGHMKQNPTRDTRPVVIVGGGNAGVSIAARLRRRGVEDVVIIEP